MNKFRTLPWVCSWCIRRVPHQSIKKAGVHTPNISTTEAHLQGIPFSAFWLRSIVISVLIIWIFDTSTIGPHDVKLIFLGEEPTTVACYWASQWLPIHCTSARAWHTPPIQVEVLRVIDIVILCCPCNAMSYVVVYRPCWNLLIVAN